MDFTVFIIVLFALQLVCLWAGNRASKKLDTQEDYFLAGKSVKFLPLMMTFVATQIGGGLVLGSAEEAYRYGWTVLFYPLGACLGFVLLACGVGRRLAHYQVSTVAQLFEVVYQSVKLKKIASLLSMISLFMILVAQVMASKKFMISLGFDSTTLFIIFWAVVIGYTIVGGLKAVVSVDIIQAIFFVVVFLLGFGYVLYASDFSITGIVQTGLNSQDFDFDPSKLCGWLLMPLLFMVIEQDMAQRCFAAQSPKIVSRAAAWSAVCMLAVCVIPVFFGVLGKSTGIEVAPGSSVFMTVMQTTTTPVLAALMGCAVLAAIISTAISLLNAVSSNLTQDFDWAYLKRASNVNISRAITAGIGVVGLIFSFFFSNVVDLLIQSYELSLCCLLVPVAAALFKRQGNTLSAAMAIGWGAAGFVLVRFISTPLPKEIVSVLFSACGFILVEGYAWMLSKESMDIKLSRGG